MTNKKFFKKKLLEKHNEVWQPFINKHKDKRCFIIGGGPSLKEENLEKLENEFVFITNKSYKAQSLGLKKYHYYVITDSRVYRQIKDEMNNIVKCPKFYSGPILRKGGISTNEDYIPFSIRKNNNSILDNDFPESVTDGWNYNGTVVLDAALIAFFMGFSKIYFLGVDFDYDKKTTHFYPSDERELKDKNEFFEKKKLILKCTENVSNFMKKNKVDFVNLSKGFAFKNQNIMESNKLENIL